MIRVRFFFCLFILVIGRNCYSSPIRILLWWDYIDISVQNKIREIAPNSELIIYKSNDVALSKILAGRENFDIVIISNSVYPILKEAGYFSDILSEIHKSRKYLKFFNKYSKCLPYLWSATLYQVSNKTNTVESLKNILKKDSKGIIIDDKFEVAARIIADEKENCAIREKNIFNCWDSELAEKTSFLSSNMFTSSIGDSLNQNYVIYGWHGELTYNFKKYKDIKYYLPSRPIVGSDLVCTSKGSSKNRNRLILKIVDILTNPISTEANSLKSGYFSPYLKRQNIKNKKLRDIYGRLLKKIEENQYYIINPPGKEKLKSLNFWWNKLRNK